MESGLLRTVTFQQFDNFQISSANGPGQWRGPRRIVGKVRFCAAVQEAFNHLLLSKLRRPAQGRGTDVLVARVQIRAVLEENRGLLDVTGSGELVQWSDP